MKKMSTILFVGPLHSGSTSTGRLNGLIKIGNIVETINTSNWLNSKYKIVNSFTNKTYISLSVVKINYEILKLALKKKYNFIWIEKGEWLFPITLFILKNNNNKIINYNTDNIFFSKASFWLHRIGIKYYDLYLTTNRFNVIEINKKYKINTLRVGMGFDSDIYFKDEKKLIIKKYDVVFIGHWEPTTEAHILALKKAGINIQVWGYNWNKSNNLELKKIQPLKQSEYCDVIANAKIALCFLSKWNMNESTGRTFEIPAIGTFMLAEYTNEQFYIYGDGVVFFSGVGELISKVKFYLKNEIAREKIALVGNSISLSPGYSWANQISIEWYYILNYFEESLDNVPSKFNDIYWEGYRHGEAAPGKNPIN